MNSLPKSSIMCVCTLLTEQISFKDISGVLDFIEVHV